MRRVDYTKFSSTGEPQAKEGAINKRWWDSPKEQIAQDVTRIVKFLGENDSRRQTQYQISTRLYGNNTLMGINGLSYTKIASVQNQMKDRVSYNLVQSAIDTITAKMAKNKPKPLFLTSGGDYKQQRKAKKLDKFVEGIFYENDAHQLGVDIFRDGAVFGDGVVHVYDSYGRVKMERTIASELYVDWVESFYGCPRQLHWVKNVDRQVLKDLYPEHASTIENANSASADLIGTYQNIADQVTVVESWHLPSSPDATDGVHCVNIPEANLGYEKWDKPYFPFAFLPWSKRMYGFWGQGAAEQLQNIQLEINKLLWVIQRSMHLAGSFKILMENGSKIVKEHFNNDIGSVITYANEKPDYITPPIVPMEIYSHLQTLKTLGFEQVGVSQLSAGAQKPAGLNSGKALREYNDIESDRFMVIGQRYEKFYLDIARLVIDVAKEIYSHTKKYQVKVPGKRFIETIDWKEIDLEEEEYTMKIFPVSSLPSEPAGRLETIQEYMQAGLISPRQGRRLLDFPDLEQIESLQNSTEEYLHMILEKIVEDGKYTPPEQYDDLALAQELGLEYYSQGKQNGLEPEKLDMLRTFLNQVQLIQARAQPPAAPAGVPGAPQAQPMPPPQSNIVPNVPGAAA